MLLPVGPPVASPPARLANPALRPCGIDIAQVGEPGPESDLMLCTGGTPLPPPVGLQVITASRAGGRRWRNISGGGCRAQAWTRIVGGLPHFHPGYTWYIGLARGRKTP